VNNNQIAEILDQAAKNAQSTAQISLQHPISLEQAYDIQALSIERRLDRGEQLTGVKLGFTSKAKMEQMGVHDMIWGRLTDAMARAHNGSISLSQFIHPRAEPEIAFLLSKDVTHALSMEEAKEYVEAVAVAIEIIDSRYENFKFSLEDVVADNCSSSAYVIGKWMPNDTTIQNIKITLSIDNQLISEGNSNAILGNPWESLLAATRLASQNGLMLKKGQIILAGAATPATYLKPSQQVEASAEGLGSVSLNSL